MPFTFGEHYLNPILALKTATCVLAAHGVAGAPGTRKPLFGPGAYDHLEKPIRQLYDASPGDQSNIPGEVMVKWLKYLEANYALPLVPVQSAGKMVALSAQLQTLANGWQVDSVNGPFDLP